MKKLLAVLPVLLALSAATVRPTLSFRSQSDSLPAGTRISFEIAVPGDPTPTKFSYVVPAPADKPTPSPVVVPDKNSLSVAQVISGQSARVGEPFSFVIPVGTFSGNVTGVDVSDLPAGLRYDSKTRTISGTPTKADKRTVTVTASDGTRIVQTSFSLSFSAKDVPIIDTPIPDDKQSTGVPTIPPIPVSGLAQRYPVAFNFSSSPNRINRMQAPLSPEYRDGWKMKQTEIVTGGNGGIIETPDELRKRGQNWFNACWFYCRDDRPYGLPKSTDNLFYEYTGNYWGPYHQNAYLAVVTDLTKIGNDCILRLAGWNSVPENGLIDGVATVKEAHFNIEYNWFLPSDWEKLNGDQRNVRYFNYAINQTESLQETYNRGGIEAIVSAQHQKFRNIIALSVLYLNRNNNGMKAFYGDFWGLSRYHDLANWNEPVSATELLTRDVNDHGLFPYANEEANAGTISLNNGQSFYVSGNLNAMQMRRNCYNYEWNVFMSYKDFQDYFAVTKDAPAEQKDIRKWHSKMRPNLTRPYDMAYHILLDKTIAAKKGWSDYKEYWQNEHIYEHQIIVPDWPGEPWKAAQGAWVPWTLYDGNTANSPTKIPLHPEVQTNLVFLSRMHYDGKFTWGNGCCSRLNPDGMYGENLNGSVHSVSREAEQSALSEINQYNETVFTADKRQHIGDIPVLTPSGQYVTGDPSVLLRANAPLVTGVDSPSTGWELYYIYYPNQSRDGQTTVRWKSPVDGAELSGVATGWGGTLYARKR
ncbi:putative Ig domain-containing protein [Spirosoma oryzicola]|uniref:putative Ig domain-containing protein n=1 Tax=Spirosoma oryzicola TaxID=2898794 RepID=UPI001E5DDFAA|nr:putative Ig domain-containing protein [Spirosoma oryzicola]UHG93283.1 putative Ig domain-containing protein [Spirosoma oryzicola]